MLATTFAPIILPPPPSLVDMSRGRSVLQKGQMISPEDLGFSGHVSARHNTPNKTYATDASLALQSLAKARYVSNVGGALRLAQPPSGNVASTDNNGTSVIASSTWPRQAAHGLVSEHLLSQCGPVRSDPGGATAITGGLHVQEPLQPLYVHAAQSQSHHKANAGLSSHGVYNEGWCADERAPTYPLLEESEEENDQFLLETFLSTRSTVLKLSAHPTRIAACVSKITIALQDSCLHSPNIYTVREDWSGPRMIGMDETWVVFSTHEEAALALRLSPTLGLHVKPALASDLQPIEKLRWITPIDTLYTNSVDLNSERVEQMIEIHTTPSPELVTPSPSDSTASSILLTPHSLRGSYSYPLETHVKGADLRRGHSTAGVKLSSNPPNPRVSFRVGDWICPIATCGMHNFGRNMSCYGCGNPRHAMPPMPNSAPGLMNMPFSTPNLHGLTGIPPQAHFQLSHSHSDLFPPRYTDDRQRRPLPPLPLTARPHPLSAAASRDASPSRSDSPHTGPRSGLGMQIPAKAPAPSYPLLTPSGHALASGGRVRNISQDPLAPCVMYWPDNEPLPERGQIRPLGSAVIQYPPIINTGNKGAAEKQPGDWCCSKCNYLNWRRRKVCQTCYPYAEGNGDSISQAVQAERIALLTNVLNQVDASSNLPLHLQRRASVPINSMAPNGPTYPAQRVVNPGTGLPMQTSVRSRSQMDLHARYRSPVGPGPIPRPVEGFAFPPQVQRSNHPIYQTPSHPTSPHTSSPARSRVPSPTSIPVSGPAPLLPSFLQDIIQNDSMQSSPATSTSSWSFDEFEYAGEYEGSGSEGDSYRYDSNFDPLLHTEVEGAPRASFVGVAAGVIGRPNQRPSAVYESRSAQLSESSIWKMDGEESRTFKPTNAPIYNVDELAGKLANTLSLVSA